MSKRHGDVPVSTGAFARVISKPQLRSLRKKAHLNINANNKTADMGSPALLAA